MFEYFQETLQTPRLPPSYFCVYDARDMQPSTEIYLVTLKTDLCRIVTTTYTHYQDMLLMSVDFDLESQITLQQCCQHIHVLHVDAICKLF